MSVKSSSSRLNKRPSFKNCEPRKAPVVKADPAVRAVVKADLVVLAKVDLVVPAAKVVAVRAVLVKADLVPWA